jgi:tRNA-splicing endonuclease subunit Sen54
MSDFSADSTPIPDLFDFERVFGDSQLEVSATPKRDTGRAVSIGKKTDSMGAWERIRSYFDWHKKGKIGSLTRPPPYARLKNGRKSAIIAVVDNGTISFQRFGDTDFTELPWVGGKQVL